MNEELQKFIDDLIKEYDDLLSMSYSYMVQNRVGKINVGKGIFEEVLKGKAWPQGVAVDTVFHNGLNIMLDLTLPDNVVETFKRNYFQGSLGGKPPIHSCFQNRKRYIGFTRVYDYCTICDDKIEIRY